MRKDMAVFIMERLGKTETLSNTKEKSSSLETLVPEIKTAPLAPPRVPKLTGGLKPILTVPKSVCIIHFKETNMEKISANLGKQLFECFERDKCSTNIDFVS